MAFGPLRCEGIGLSDGETMERLWSYLRRFGRMTKEMRPAHRTDVLVHALLYYCMKTKAKLGVFLLVKSCATVTRSALFKVYCTFTHLV